MEENIKLNFEWFAYEKREILQIRLRNQVNM